MRTSPAGALFRAVHGRRLVYNTCWEDPRLDREALALGRQDVVVTITSAGCNALDYALDEPRHVFAVDLNPRQNALLELKQAGIRALAFEDFFDLFGRGRLGAWASMYPRLLRPQLSAPARAYWDEKGGYFAGRRGRRSFYFHGTTGAVATLVNAYLDHVAGARAAIDALLSSRTVEEQREIYVTRVRGRVWRPWFRWFAGWDPVLALLAVPRPQREHLEREYRRGIAAFIEERIEAVFTRLPLADNYFWRVYLNGAYTPECCPEYLRRPSFERLKGGLVDRITTHTSSLTAFLEAGDEPISRFVLLDHMDWLCETPATLGAEWEAILARATPDARVLWRSGGFRTDFVDALDVRVRGRRTRLGERLRYAHTLAASLHARDRVHTYGSFHIAGITP